MAEALKLKVDVATFEKTKSSIQQRHAQIEDLLASFTTTVDTLTGNNGGFDSQAGQEFRSQYTELANSIKRSQEKLMDHITDLTTAAERYKAVDDAQKNAASQLMSGSGEIF